MIHRYHNLFAIDVLLLQCHIFAEEIPRHPPHLFFSLPKLLPLALISDLILCLYFAYYGDDFAMAG